MMIVTVAARFLQRWILLALFLSGIAVVRVVVIPVRMMIVMVAASFAANASLDGLCQA
jgi:hypothetical protein